jgi:hypothetical protein
MDFRTPVFVEPSPVKISLLTPVLALGSCFAETIGKRLTDNKFQTLVNPLGIIFNPVFLNQIIQVIAGKTTFREDLVLEHRSRFYHYQAHSSQNENTSVALLESLQQKAEATRSFLQKADFLILTLGTAFIYRHLPTQAFIANCHKQPAGLFEKQLLPLEMLMEALENVLQTALSLNPKLHILLTVSPVRHTRDTLLLNQASKSLLRVACHEICLRYPESTGYFPAYEMMMDDLRDYRFYKTDMIHPSETAENYIWEKFSATYLNENSQEFLKKWEKIRQAGQHHAFQPESSDFQDFVRKILKQLYALRSEADVETEILAWEGKLIIRNGV